MAKAPRDPVALSGNPVFPVRKKRRKPKRAMGYQVIQPIASVKAHTVKPPANLIAQVARFIVGDTSGFRTDWPSHVLHEAERAMRSVHVPGMEATGSRWVQRTRNQLRRAAKP